MTTPILSPIPDGFKRCTKCGEIKPLDAFSPASGCKDGRRGVCKDCRNLYFKEIDAKRAGIPRPRRDMALAAEWEKNYKGRRAELDAKRRNKENYAEHRNELRRAQYAANPEKYREGCRRRNEQKRASNPELYKAEKVLQSRKWRAANLEHAREYDRQHYAEHREKHSEQNRRWHVQNMDSARSRRQTRRARKAETAGTFTAADLTAIRAAQTDKRGRLICWRCGRPIKGTPDLDHWIPLKHGGRNDAGNLHYMHARCNLEKAAKLPTEIGRLL